MSQSEACISNAGQTFRNRSWISLVFVVSLSMLVACGGGESDDPDELPSGSQPESDSPNPLPSDLFATAGDSRVTLRWSSADSAGSYCIYVSDAANIHPDTVASYDADLSTCITSTDTSYTVTNLTNNTEYFFVVTSEGGSSESAASNEVTATPMVSPVATRPLNDTGIDWCSDASTTDLVCGVSGFPGQDGEHGRDARARAGNMAKIGNGEAGFDFTKLDEAGNPLAENAAQWSCVRDNHTGLVWEVKANDGGLRDTHVYTWYNPDSNSNGGSAGSQSDPLCTRSACNTHTYVQAVNEQSLCGASDWRMPTRNELLNIMHNARDVPGEARPAIDQNFFPNAPVFSEWFWSSSPSTTHSNAAWMVNFNGGSVIDAGKGTAIHIRLVRAAGMGGDEEQGGNEQTPPPGNEGGGGQVIAGRYQVSDNGHTVKDLVNGLTWQRCSVGQTWNGSTCYGTATSMGWDGAMAAIAPPGFRLPTVEELRALVFCSNSGNFDSDGNLDACGDFGAFQSPTINAVAFPDTPERRFWTSSMEYSESDFTGPWAVNFWTGDVGDYHKNSDFVVRFVKRVGDTSDGSMMDRYRPIEGGSVIRDDVTELEWQRCSVGQSWNAADQSCDSNGNESGYYWDDAVNLTAAGGFRIPTIEQLRTLVYCSNTGEFGNGLCTPEGAYDRPTIDQVAFPNTHSEIYWSGSPIYSGGAWILVFSNGNDTTDGRNRRGRVRLVRTGQ